jgi:hypothetical protein
MLHTLNFEKHNTGVITFASYFTMNLINSQSCETVKVLLSHKATDII